MRQPRIQFPLQHARNNDWWLRHPTRDHTACCVAGSDYCRYAYRFGRRPLVSWGSACPLFFLGLSTAGLLDSLDDHHALYRQKQSLPGPLNRVSGRFATGFIGLRQPISTTRFPPPGRLIRSFKISLLFTPDLGTTAHFWISPSSTPSLQRIAGCSSSLHRKSTKQLRRIPVERHTSPGYLDQKTFRLPRPTDLHSSTHNPDRKSSTHARPKPLRDCSRRSQHLPTLRHRATPRRRIRQCPRRECRARRCGERVHLQRHDHAHGDYDCHEGRADRVRDAELDGDAEFDAYAVFEWDGECVGYGGGSECDGHGECCAYVAEWGGFAAWSGCCWLGCCGWDGGISCRLV